MKKIITLLLAFCLLASSALFTGCGGQKEEEKEISFPETLWENEGYRIVFFDDGYAELTYDDEVYLGTYTVDDDGTANIMLESTRLSCRLINGELHIPGVDEDIVFKQGRFTDEPQCEHKPNSDDPLMNTSWLGSKMKFSFHFGGILKAEDLRTGEITEGYYFWYGDGAGYASYGDETMTLAYENGILSVSTDNENYSVLTPDDGRTPVVPDETNIPDETDVPDETDRPDDPSVLNYSFLAPPDMEGFEQNEKVKNPDGTYYYTYYNAERSIDLINTAFFMPEEEDEMPEEFVLRALLEAVGTEIYDLTAGEGAGLYTCYYLSWQTGENEDTRQSDGLMVIDGDMVYLAYFELTIDFYEDNETDIGIWLNAFTLIFFPEE